MSSSSMASKSLLAMAVIGLMGMGLSMQAAAQTSGAAVTKPVLKAAPAKAGSGMTANVSVNDGGGGNGSSTMTCTVGEDGRTICEPVVVSGGSSGGGGNVQPPVVVTGNSSGGSGGDSFYLPIENPQGTPPNVGGAGSGTGGGSEAFFNKQAAEIAKGLVLPCPMESEPDEIYIARMTRYCESTVEKAFPVITWIFSSLPKEACVVAGISGKAGLVIAGVLECKRK